MSNLKIKLKKPYLGYLNENLINKKEGLIIDVLPIHNKRNDVFIEVSDDDADEIREWACDRLVYCGFDANYELNADGKILNELIDFFYVG